MQTIPLRTSHARSFLFIGLAVSLSACGGDAAGLDEDDVIDREVFIAVYVDLRAAALSTDDGKLTDEVFIAVYVDLRAAALSTDDGKLTDEARVEVLSRHGASEADVLNFAEYHARDLPFMRVLWDEIEVLLEAKQPMIDDPGDR